MKDMMLKLYVNMQTLMASEEGQDLVEYALLAALLALAAVASIGNVAGQVVDTFNTITNKLTAANAV